MLKCVMLDLGSTLLNSYNEALSCRIYYKLLKKSGCKVSLKALRKVRYEEVRKHAKENFGKTHRLHRTHLIVYRVLKRLGCAPTETEIHRFAHEYRKEVTKHYKLYPGTLRVVAALKKRGFRLAIICNGRMHWASRQVRHFGLKPYIDLLVVSDQVGKEKSSLVPFKIALKKLRLKPCECLMVGDRLDEDMRAKKLGIWTCHAAYGPGIFDVGPRMKPDFRINDIRKLPKIIEMLERRKG